MMKQVIVVTVGSALGTAFTGCVLSATFLVEGNKKEAKRNINAIDFLSELVQVGDQSVANARDKLLPTIENDLNAAKQAQLQWLSLPFYKKIESPPTLLEAIVKPK